MNRDLETILERASAWHIASEREDMDWDAFTAWLEADPRHRIAYDEIALADATLERHAGRIAGSLEGHDDADMPANDTANVTRLAPVRRWAPWAGGAIAASLLALAIIPQIQGPSPQEYSTGPNSLAIALDDGSAIELAPNSHLTVEGRHQEQLALEGGAWFDIRHDPSRAMTIRAGDMAISDIGTSFDIQSTPGQLRVEVAEGEVSVSSGKLAQPVRLAAGRGLYFDQAAGTALTMQVRDGEFGEWRQGRLSYDMAPLALVVADLSRYAGIEVSLSEGAENRQFSGTLAIEDGAAVVRDLAQLMGLVLERDGDRYRLGSDPG